MVRNRLVECHGIVNNLPEDILLHDDSLLPLWQQLGEAAASLAASSDKNSSDKLTISIVNVETPSSVMKILTSALEKLPIKLKFENNRLCSDGLIGLTNLVRKNSSISRLYLSKNGIYNYELLSLAEAISTTGRARIIPWLNQISRPIELDQVVVPSLFTLRTVALTNSSLGSKSALIISQHLANNPSINFLYLNGNLFNNDDAVLFAKSLQSNTNLIQLDLRYNNFTNKGIKTLYGCVYNDESLNLMYDTNATCQIILFGQEQETPDGVPNKLILTFNDKASDGMHAVISKAYEYVIGPLARENTLFASIILRLSEAANGDSIVLGELIHRGRSRRLKILHALQDSNTGVLNMRYLKDIPLQYIPNVLVFVQECGDWSQSEEKNLDRVYQVIKSRPGVLMSEFVAGRKKSKFRLRGRQSSHQCSCSIM